MTSLAASRKSFWALAAVGTGLVWTALAFVSWRNLAQGAVLGFPSEDAAYAPSRLFSSAVQLSPVLAVILLNAAAAIIGYAMVIRPIWGERGLASAPWLVIAGVIPGFLMIVPVSRIATLLLPNAVAPWAILPIVALAASASLVLLIAAERRRPRSRLLGRTIVWRHVWAPSALLGLSLFFTIQFDVFHIAGEAILYFITNVFLSPEHGIGTTGHWPMFSQHYDEAAFLYPIVYGFVTPGADAQPTLVFLYWITLSIWRVGAIGLGYIAVRALGLDRMSAFALLTFLFCASLSLNPLISRLLFDSLSPLGYTLHVSRIIVPLLPVVLLAAAPALRRPPTPAALGLLALFGLGLSSLTFHVALALFWAGSVVVLTALWPAASSASSAWRAACAAALVLLIGFSITYGIGHPPATIAVGLLVGASAVATLILAWLLLSPLRAFRWDAEALREPIRQMIALVAIGVGYAFGFLLLGNIIANKTIPLLSEIWPWSDTTVLYRISSGIMTPAIGLEQSAFCDAGFQWMHRALGAHCGSLPSFVATYGLPMVAMTILFGWQAMRSQRPGAGGERQRTMELWGMLLCFLALPAMFIGLDFLSPTRPMEAPIEFFTGWLRTRFVELWFYGGLALALVVALREINATARQALQGALLAAAAVFGLAPLLAPAQLALNVTNLLSALALR